MKSDLQHKPKLIRCLMFHLKLQVVYLIPVEQNRTFWASILPTRCFFFTVLAKRKKIKHFKLNKKASQSNNAVLFQIHVIPAAVNHIIDEHTHTASQTSPQALFRRTEPIRLLSALIHNCCHNMISNTEKHNIHMLSDTTGISSCPRHPTSSRDLHLDSETLCQTGNKWGHGLKPGCRSRRVQRGRWGLDQ